MKIGTLEIIPISEKPELVAGTVRNFIENHSAGVFGLVEIDPMLADTAAFCEHYQASLEESANCVIVKGTRGDNDWFAACVILATTRADVNGLVRKHLGARRASFAPMDEVAAVAQMEYGGITPIGLPRDWQVLIDKAVADSPRLIVGSGVRGSKIIVTGKCLASLPNAVTLENLGVIKR